jgi:hypothetical protein
MIVIAVEMGNNPVRDGAFGLELKVVAHPRLKALTRHWIPLVALYLMQ